MPVRRAVIVGAGIAGLTAALALARRGISSSLLEQTERLEPVGAGLQLSPNASRLLRELGLEAALEAVWHEPDSIRLVSGLDLRQIAEVPAGARARQRWGAPYGVLHRADLQQVLLEAVGRCDLIDLKLGNRFVPDESLLQDADLVVGADGVWSAVRGTMPAAGSPRFTGHLAWRLNVAAGRVSGFADPDLLTAFIGPDCHLVCYPLKRHGTVNLVAIVKGPERDASDTIEWNHAASFRRWDRRLRRLLSEAELLGCWPVYESPRTVWHAGNKVLIGDAAHAMTPYAAQGAAMAIEDAYALAACAADCADLPAALSRFATLRTERIEKVRRRAAFNRFAYHARGPFRLGRDIILSLRPPESLAADFDWLYGDRMEI